MKPQVIVEDQLFHNFEHNYEVAVYFPDSPANLYQLEQWLVPLEHLDELHRVMLICRSYKTFCILRERTQFPLIFVRRVSDLDNCLARGDIKLVLYVNHARSNFQMLRYGDMIHVHIGHGESEKTSMTSHQIRAYDYGLVAGQRAINRYEASLLEFDDNLRGRLLPIGRPQLDVDYNSETVTAGRKTVLYAPTWEGDRPSMRYSSVSVMGVAIAEAILASSAYRLVYRPHPRTGAYEADVKEADRRIRRMILETRDLYPEAGHVVDKDSSLWSQIRGSAIGIVDLSAVALDYLASSKPVMITRVNDALVTNDDSKSLLEVCYRIGPEDTDLVGNIDHILERDPKRDDRLSLAEEYFGDLTPGASMHRFVQACSGLIKRRDALIGGVQRPLRD
jgi:hypothetical protein